MTYNLERREYMTKFSVTTSVSFGSSASATLTSSLKRHGKKNTRVMQSTGKPLQGWVSSLVAPRVRFHAYQLPPDIPHMSGTASSANNCKREAGGTVNDPRPTTPLPCRQRHGSVRQCWTWSRAVNLGRA